MVHGDDFLAVGDKASTDSLKKVLMDAYKVKVEILGDGDGEASEIGYLSARKPDFIGESRLG